jgi:hypothetical protein
MAKAKLLTFIPADPAIIKKIKGLNEEFSAAMTRIASERDLIKSMLSEKSEELGIEKKLLAKVAKAYHAQTFAQTIDGAVDFKEAFETVYGEQAVADLTKVSE